MMLSIVVFLIPSTLEKAQTSSLCCDKALQLCLLSFHENKIIFILQGLSHLEITILPGIAR